LNFDAANKKGQAHCVKKKGTSTGFWDKMQAQGAKFSLLG
jgi:hypothetical protein